MYSPVAGSSRWDPARWHSPSRSATRPPSEPTFDEARVTSGSSARRADAARSRTRSCEPIATIVREISSMPRSSSTSTCSPAWWPSWPAGTTSSPSARTSEVSTPGAARQRGGDHRAADHAQPHPDPVVHAERGGELAGQPGRGPRPLARRRARQLGEQRLGEDVEGQRRGHRVAGRAEHRRAADHARARPGGPAGPRRRARPASRARPPPGRCSRPGPRWSPATMISRSQSADRGGDRVGDAVRVVRLDRQAVRLAAGLAGLGGQHQRVRVDDLAGGGRPRRSAAPRPRSAGSPPPGRRRTSRCVAPAAAAAARSVARSRWPSGSSSSAALTSSPIERTCW